MRKPGWRHAGQLLSLFLALYCAFILKSFVFQRFDRIRIVVLRDAREASPQGRLHLPLPDLSAFGAEPIAVVLRMAGDATPHAVRITVAGSELGRAQIVGRAEQRFDFVLPAGLNALPRTMELEAARGGWAVRYLEFANIHGHSGGLLPLVVVPKNRSTFPGIDLAVVIVFFVALIWLPRRWLHDASTLERRISLGLGAIGLLLFIGTAIAPVLTPFRVLLGVQAFVLGVVLIYLPALRRAFLWVPRLLRRVARARGGLVGGFVMRVRRRLGTTNRWALGFIVAVFGTLYGATLYPDMGGRVNFGDSVKWQFLWLTNGTPHATGYPLFLILTKFFGHSLVWWEPYFRITVMSAVFGVAALCLAYLTWETLTGRKIPSLAAVCLLGTSLSFWTQSTEAEVYTLNALFVAAVLYLFVRFHATGDRRCFLVGSAVYALSFGNHLTMITLLPALAYLTLSRDRGLLSNARYVAFLVGVAAAGASQYGYLLYLSHHGGRNLEGIGADASFWDLVNYATGGNFRHEMLSRPVWDGLSSFARQLRDWEIGAAPFLLGVGALVAAGSGFWGSRADRRAYLFLALAAAGQVAFAVTYDIGDIVVFYLPATMILCFFCTLPGPWLRWNVAAVTLVFATSLWNAVTHSEKMTPQHVFIAHVVRYLHAQVDGDGALYSAGGISTFEYYGANAWKYAEAVAPAGHAPLLADDPAQLAGRERFYTFASDLPSLKPLAPLDVTPVATPLSFPTVWNRHREHLVLLAVRGHLSSTLMDGLNAVLAASGAGVTTGANRSFVAVFLRGQPLVARAANVRRLQERIDVPGLGRTFTLISEGDCCGAAAPSGLVYGGRVLESVNGPGLNIVALDPGSASVVARYSFQDVQQDETSYPPLLLKVNRTGIAGGPTR